MSFLSQWHFVLHIMLTSSPLTFILTVGREGNQIQKCFSVKPTCWSEKRVDDKRSFKLYTWCYLKDLSMKIVANFLFSIHGNTNYWPLRLLQSFFFSLEKKRKPNMWQKTSRIVFYSFVFFSLNIYSTIIINIFINLYKFLYTNL